MRSLHAVGPPTRRSVVAVRIHAARVMMMMISTLWQVEEREAQIQELQDTITELHQEMSLKDQDKLGQLQQLVQLETRVKELTQEVVRSWSFEKDRSVQTPR